MRILVIDPKAVALDWCMRCINHGHTVKWWNQNLEKTKYVGLGLVDKIGDWREYARWPDLVFIADNTHWLRELDAWRRRGLRIFGPTVDMADLELDRSKGQALFKKHGIPTLPQRTFKAYDPAITFVKREMRRFVSKPSGDADKALSYCAKSPADMVYMLERWKKLGKLKGDFLLQDFVEGCEMAVGGFFGPSGFNTGWCENWEFKKLMNNDVGVATGEQGTVLRFVEKSKLANRVLRPLEDYLKQNNYVGYIDVNCIIDDKGTPWPLEFTCRPGWPTFNIQQVLHEGDPAEWVVKTIEGSDPANFRLNEVALGVVMTIPDYPYSHLTRKEVVGIPIYNSVMPSMLSHLSPGEVMAGTGPIEENGKIVDKPMYVTAGDYIMVVSGTGKTVLEAKEQAYRLIKRVHLPNSPMYRTDIGNRLRKQLPKIQSQGYALNLAWTEANA